MKKLLIALALLLTALPARATVIWSDGGESYSDGTTLPNPYWCGTPCSGSLDGTAEIKANCDPAGSAPQGNMCMRWDITANLLEAYHEIGPEGSPKFNYDITEGQLLILAFRQNISRIGGVDIWHELTDDSCGDKGIGLHGKETGDFRWDLSMGQWESQAQNTDHHWTVWGGNPSNHFNSELEIVDTFVQNVSPYSASNPIQLDYDRWYNFIMELKMSGATPHEGHLKIYVNGTKIIEYLNIQTTAVNTGSNIEFDWIEFYGTLCQPLYHCPAHTRFIDDMTVATSSADVTSFMSDPEAAGTTLAPLAPKLLRVLK